MFFEKGLGFFQIKFSFQLQIYQDFKYLLSMKQIHLSP